MLTWGNEYDEQDWRRDADAREKHATEWERRDMQEPPPMEADVNKRLGRRTEGSYLDLAVMILIISIAAGVVLMIVCREPVCR